MTGKRQAWLVTIVAFLAGVATTANQFKVPPALPMLSAELHLDPVAAGWLMSVFSMAAVVLSIPAALLLGRVGFRAMGVVALGCVVAGAALGAAAPSAAVLLLSRVVEGISIALIAVVAPALISHWFPPEALGLPMGLWATWVPAGSVLMLTVGPLLEQALGWRAVWWFGALLGLILLVAYGLLARPPGEQAGRTGGRGGTSRGVRETERGREKAGGLRGSPKLVRVQSRPPGASPGVRKAGRGGHKTPTSRGVREEGRGGREEERGGQGPWRAVLSPGNWLLGVAFGSFALALISYNTWAPTFLSARLGIAPARASFYTSLVFLAGIAANLLAGWLMTRLRLGYALLAGALAVTAGLYGAAFRLGGGIVVPYLLALGFVANLVPTAVFTLAPETVRRPELAGVAMAVLNVAANLGILVGPPLLGGLVGRGQWAAAAGLLAGVSALGLAASLLAWRLAAAGKRAAGS